MCPHLRLAARPAATPPRPPQFLTASFICPTLANCALAVLLMLTAGGQAERLLGRSRFAAVYLLAGASANLGCGRGGGRAGYPLGPAPLRSRRLLQLFSVRTQNI